eukprot:gene8379-biopygen8348
MLAQERPVARYRCGALEPLQVLLPPLARLGEVLALQPGDVIAVTRWRRQLRFATFAEGHVDVEEIVHQQRAAPRIDQDVVVAHHEPVAGFAYADQPQVEGRLVKQIETGFTLAFQQRLQARFLLAFRLLAPVEVLDRRAAGLVDNLQHVFADVPAERGAQGFMTGDHRLPGLGETLGVQGAVDAVAVLHVVEAGARFQQGVQQQAFLHRGQRVHVFDGIGRHRQRIELPLGQVRQREVRRRKAARVCLEAMFDQALQFRQVSVRQFSDGLAVVTLAAEGPAQHQLTAVHLAVDTQRVGQRRVRVVGDPGGLVQRVEQCVGAKALVELAEVIEGDTGARQRGHGLAAQVVGQVAQHAITQPLVGHAAQLLLDRLDRGALPGGLFDMQRGQAQRVGAGEPADAAGQVDLVE